MDIQEYLLAPPRVPPPPTVRNRSGWWHRPEAPVGHTSDHPETTDDGSHRYAATFPARGVAPAGADGLLASAPHVPGLLLRALSLPTYSSTGSQSMPVSRHVSCSLDASIKHKADISYADTSGHI